MRTAGQCSSKRGSKRCVTAADVFSSRLRQVSRVSRTTLPCAATNLWLANESQRVRTEWRRILKQLTRPEEPDAVLLRRFIELRDAEAFAELVRRYDALVWSQCRHLLGCEADAD